MSKNMKLSLAEVKELATKALCANGFSIAQADAIAQTVTAAERDECKSHGLFRIPLYLKAGANPTTDAKAEPKLSVTNSSVVHVDGVSGFCPLALNMGLPLLVEKTKQHGIAALAIHNVYNIAALWPEVESLAEQGLVAFAFTAANSYVAPHGGTKPVFGTNPMAFAWPRVSQPPLVFDQASSASARGEIQLHALEGKAIPDGWAVDSDGQPTNDPDAALAGAQLPFGGHKGSSLALMVELLAGALIGDLFSYESSAQYVNSLGAPFGGEFLIAIDLAHTLQQSTVDQDLTKGEQASSTQTNEARISAAQGRAEKLFELILEQEGTRLPSSRRYAARTRTDKDGVEVAENLHQQIIDLC